MKQYQTIDKNLIKTLKTMKIPYNVTIDIVDAGQYVGLRIYENEVLALSNEKRLYVMEHLQKMRQMVEAFGYTCHFQGSKGDPPRRR